MTALPEAPSAEPARYRRFRLIRGGARGHDQVVPEIPPKLVLLSPASARWMPTLGDALGPSYRVVRETSETPAAVVVDSRDDELVGLIQDQRSATRVIVVHTGHPSEQPMASVGAARPRRRHLPRADVASCARRAREGIDPLLGRVPAAPDHAGRIGDRSSDRDRPSVSVALTLAHTSTPSCRPRSRPLRP